MTSFSDAMQCYGFTVGSQFQREGNLSYLFLRVSDNSVWYDTLRFRENCLHSTSIEDMIVSVTKYHAMKALRGKLHTFLTSTVGLDVRLQMFYWNKSLVSIGYKVDCILEQVWDCGRETNGSPAGKLVQVRPVVSLNCPGSQYGKSDDDVGEVTSHSWMVRV